MNRLVYIVTDPMTARILLAGQLEFMSERGYAVSVIAGSTEDLDEISKNRRIKVFSIPMAREISPARDLLALWRLYVQLRRLQPTIVNASTPKAGLLGTLAARMAGVPARVYTLRGLRVETVTGWKRHLLKFTEKIASWSASHVICVSDSLRSKAVALKLASPAKLLVLGAGSSNGVDARRFGAQRWDGRTIESLARIIGLAPHEPVVGFVGRLTRDKGVEDLHRAVELVRRRVPGVQLLLVGDFESGDALPESCRARLRSDDWVVTTGFVDDAAPYYQLMTVFAFPSYREGFPNVALEAAAAGLPIAGFDATGTRDAVLNGETGTLVPTGDVSALAAALVAYLEDGALRNRHGHAGEWRAACEFSPLRVWRDTAELYDYLARKG